MSSEPIHVNYPDPRFWSKTAWIQLGYGFWVNLTNVSIGLAFGFSTVFVSQIQEPDSGFHLTKVELSWMVSVILLCAPLGCLICGLMMDRIGRKAAIIASHLPLVLGSTYAAFGTNAIEFILGRAICGVGVGMAIAGPRVYTTEIALPNMRGVIGALHNTCLSLGLLIEAITGSYLDWKMLCLLNAMFSCLLFISYTFLPESPYYVLLNDSIDETRDSLAKFRSRTFNLDVELEEMMEYKQNNSIRRLSLWRQTAAMFRPSACKPFAIIMVYSIITQLAGVSIMAFWTIDVIKSSNCSVPHNIGNVIMANARLVGGLACSIMLYKFGRKTLSIASGLGIGVSAVTLGVLVKTTTQATIYPMFCLSSFVLFASIGFYTLPLLIMTELYPLQVRGLLGGVTVSLLNILMFAANDTYLFFKKILGFELLMVWFGICAFLGCIYLFFCLPETKDLTLQEIEEYFNSRRATLFSQRQLLSQLRLKMDREKLASSSVRRHVEIVDPKGKNRDADSKSSNYSSDFI